MATTALQPVKTTAVARGAEPVDLFKRMHQLSDIIEKRAFEIFDNNGRWSGHERADWLQAEAELLRPVHLEISETDAAFNVRAEVPGFDAKELDIRVEPSRITIAGKHETQEENKKGKTIYSERCAQEILRTLSLPEEIDSSKVNATLKDGILIIELPKVAAAKRVRVEPRAGD